MNPHRNFLWAEFVNVIHEQNQTMKRYLRQNMDIVALLHQKGDKVADGIDDRFEMLISKLHRAESLLQEIANEPPFRHQAGQMNQSSRRIAEMQFLNNQEAKYWDLNNICRGVPIGHANLLIPLTLSCLRLRDSAEFNIGSLTLEEEFYDAASNLLNETYRIRYGDKLTQKELLPTPICWPQHDYSYLGHSKLIAIPPCDADKCDFGTNIVHESIHWMLGEVEIPYFAVLSAGSEERVAEYATEAGFEQPHLVAHWNWKRIELALQLKGETLGQHLEMTWRRTDTFDRAIPPLAHFVWQVNEIFCDIATAKICGLPELYAKGVIWAPSLRNSLYGLDRYIEEPTHPPESIRIWYIMEALKANDMGYTKSDLQFFENNLKELREFDTTSEPYEPVLMSLQRNAIQPFIPIISKLITGMFQKQYFFTAEKWRKIEEGCDASAPISKILDSMDPSDRARCMIGISWLKRTEIHKSWNVSSSDYDVKSLRQRRRDQRSFFADLVREMAK